jgi:superfamily II DNA/RNA helicase
MSPHAVSIFPIHSEDYVHRIGRTGRAGRLGKAFTIATRNDAKYIDAIEKLIGQSIEWLDGDLSTVEESAEDEAPRRGKGSPRRDGRKSEGRERKPRGGRHHEAASDSAGADAQDQPAQKSAPQAANTDRRPRNWASEDSRPARDHRRRYDDDDGDTPVGFGEDIPAFMLIEAKV